MRDCLSQKAAGKAGGKLGRGGWRQLLGFAALAVLLAGLYLLLAGQASGSELGAAAVVALLGTGFAASLRHCGGRGLSFADRPSLRVVGRLLAALAGDSVRVGRVLARVALRGASASPGRVLVQGFRAGADTPRAEGRRALVVLGASLAPNGFVVEVEAGQDLMRVHHLAPAPAKADRTWPV